MGLPLTMDERQICVQRAICASPGTIFKVLASPAGHVSIDAIFPVISETNLRATLGILARTVAPGLGRPGAGED